MNKLINEIIIIDDDYASNFVNQKIIERFYKGIQISVFENIDEALIYLSFSDKTGNFLIFLDLHMPKRNGWDFLTEYDKFKIKSPVVILTGSLSDNDVNRAKKYEIVTQYLIKPVSLHHLEEIAQQLEAGTIAA